MKYFFTSQQKSAQLHFNHSNWRWLFLNQWFAMKVALFKLYLYLVFSISQFFTSASILAWVDLTLVNLGVAESPSEARVAVAGEVVDAVHADSVLTEIVDAVIVVDLTSAAGESRWTITDEGAESISAGSSIVAG